MSIQKFTFKKVVFFSALLLIFIFIILQIITKNTTESTYTTLVQKNSSCINCHTTMSGFSPAHAPDKTSCIACHLGDNVALDKNQAHHNMLLVPGNLSNASQTCAKCHEGIDIRVNNSIMNTMSGIISVDKHIFNENDNLDSLFNIHHLKNNSFADSHLRNKCASCHIGNEKTHPSPISQKTRGGGCTACHLNYSDEAKKAHKKYLLSDKTVLTKQHPSLSLKITDNHCFGCHSRSGRISTNYEGWHETLFRDTLKNNSNYRILEDARIFEKQTADVHHANGMSCIDCHDTNDVMGDGKMYAHQENATNISCKDCHFTDALKRVSFSELNEDEKRIIRLRKIDSTHSFSYSPFTDKNSINVIHENGNLYVLTKNTSKKITISKASSQCTKKAHTNVSCTTCHTSWAPQCISCHTSFDKNEDGYDLLDKQWRMGTWNEKGGDFLAEFPTLGVIEKNNGKEIKTFSPGMVLSLQKGKNTSFHRLFAPVSAHTISAKGQNCKTCHNNPVALGYGRGDLTFTKNGRWIFKPTYAKSNDGLPQDAWIPFLKDDLIGKATRNNARPFTRKEQQKILRVGACLTCHKENSKVANAMLDDFDKTLLSVSNDCVLPVF